MYEAFAAEIAIVCAENAAETPAVLSVLLSVLVNEFKETVIEQETKVDVGATDKSHTAVGNAVVTVSPVCATPLNSKLKE